MHGIISLLSDFSIYTILHGTRISLAHLIEFSNFIDLYILEDEILVDSYGKEHGYFEYHKLQNSPIKFITDSALNDAVSNVSLGTREIYDLSPVNNFTFSFDSYEYWTEYSNIKRRELMEIHMKKFTNFINSKDEPLTQLDQLHSSSERMDKGIMKTLEQLSNTKFALTPSTRNLLPFLDAFHQIETPTQKMYKKIAIKHKRAVEKILQFQRPRMIYLPPLLSILLSRCSAAKDIPVKLRELREEYSQLRKEISELLSEMNQVRNLKEQFEIRSLFENTINENAKKYEKRQKGFYKNVSGAFLDAFDDGDLTDIVSKPAVAIAKEGLNYLPNVVKTKRLTGFVNLLDDSFKVFDYQKLLVKVFKDRLDISQYEITQIKKYYNYIENNYQINMANSPG